MWLGWGHELGEAEFQGIFWAEQSLLTSLMTSQLCWCCFHKLGGGLKRVTMHNTSTSAQERALPLALSLTTQCPLVSPWCPCAADLALVHHHKSLLLDMTLLRGICSCWLQLPQSLSHSAAGYPAASCLHPLLPSTIAG